MITNNSRFVVLSGIGYRVTEFDDQVLFSEEGGCWGCHSRFAFEWRGQAWYLIDIDGSSGGIFASHITSALKWLKENYDEVFVDGVGEVTLRADHV